MNIAKEDNSAVGNSRLYKKVGLINFLLSTLAFLVDSELPLEERITVFVVINFGFHLLYHTIRIAPLSQLTWLQEESIVYAFYLKGMKLMAVFIIAASIFMFFKFLFDILILHDLKTIPALLVPFGPMLGATQLRLSLKQL